MNSSSKNRKCSNCEQFGAFGYKKNDDDVQWILKDVEVRRRIQLVAWTPVRRDEMIVPRSPPTSAVAIGSDLAFGFVRRKKESAKFSPFTSRLLSQTVNEPIKSFVRPLISRRQFFQLFSVQSVTERKVSLVQQLDTDCMSSDSFLVSNFKSPALSPQPANGKFPRNESSCGQSYRWRFMVALTSTLNSFKSNS
jgi:hypothetical protein